MRILALDQSVTRSGWAVVDAEPRQRSPNVVASGWFGSSPLRGSGSGQATTDDRKVELFEEQVRFLILDYEPKLLAWEAPAKFIPTFARKGGGRAVNAHQLVLTRLGQVMLNLADRFDLYSAVPPARTWRAAVLGKGCGALPKREAKKRAVAYCAWLGVPVSNDDTAEAVCIGLWAATCSKAVLEAEAST